MELIVNEDDEQVHDKGEEEYEDDENPEEKDIEKYDRYYILVSDLSSLSQ